MEEILDLQRMSSWAAAESAVKARNSEEAANLRISKEKKKRKSREEADQQMLSGRPVGVCPGFFNGSTDERR